MIATTSRPVSRDSAESTERERMGTTVGGRALAFTRHRAGSPYVRLAQELGVAKEKTARDQLPWLYRRVAIANRVLLEAGMSEKVGEMMAVVEASLMGEVPPLADAINSHNRLDAVEDVCQAEFIRNAGDDELRAWIKKLAADVRAAEVLLSALCRERDARKGVGE